jgi:hypothetical protein
VVIKINKTLCAKEEVKKKSTTELKNRSMVLFFHRYDEKKFKLNCVLTTPFIILEFGQKTGKKPPVFCLNNLDLE